MPVCVLLEAVGYGQQATFVKIIANNMQADRAGAVATETARDRHGRQAGQAHAQSIDVGQPVCRRILVIVANILGNIGGNRPDNDVALGGKRLVKIIHDQAANALRLQVISIVVALRQYV